MPLPSRLLPSSASASARNVLVTDGGSGQNRSAVAAVRALAAAGYLPSVTVSGLCSLAAASRHCAATIPVPDVDSPGYAQGVCAALDAQPYLAVLPASDAALVALDLPGADLVDKASLAERAKKAHLPLPEQRIFESWGALILAVHDLEYPVVLKPTIRSTSRQAAVVRVDSPQQLMQMPTADGAVVVQRFVAGSMTAVSGVVWAGRLVATVHQRYERIWPLDAGVACALETTPGDSGLEERLVHLLQGYNGIFQAQFVGSFLVDVNPRVYGSLPLAVAAGANLPAIHCDLLRGEEVSPVRGTAGVRYRWLEGDLRHLHAMWRRGELGLPAVLSALRPRRGTAHSVESISDPGPALSRLRYARSGWSGRTSYAAKR